MGLQARRRGWLKDGWGTLQAADCPPDQLALRGGLVSSMKACAEGLQQHPGLVTPLKPTGWAACIAKVCPIVLLR